MSNLLDPTVPRAEPPLIAILRDHYLRGRLGIAHDVEMPLTYLELLHPFDLKTELAWLKGLATGTATQAAIHKTFRKRRIMPRAAHRLVLAIELKSVAKLTSVLELFAETQDFHLGLLEAQIKTLTDHPGQKDVDAFWVINGLVKNDDAIALYYLMLGKPEVWQFDYTRRERRRLLKIARLVDERMVDLFAEMRAA